MSNPRKVIVIGASRSPGKYGNKAVRAYLEQGDDVYPVNIHGGSIAGRPIWTSLGDLPIDSADLVSMYVPPEVGVELLDEIARLQPREVWLNPGSESPELLERAEELGLNTIQACSILGLGRSPREF